MGHRIQFTIGQRIRGFLQLLRVPNLFTVPGDPLAGLAVATLLGAALPAPGRWLLTAGVALFFYAYGLVLNDLHDLEHDRLTRPNRPLPRRLVSLPEALVLTALCAAGGLICAWRVGYPCFALALCLLFFISTYDILAKDWGWLGCLVMGLCRGTSFLLGVPLSGWSAPLLALALCLTLYIALVTRLSQREEAEWRHGWRAYRPALTMAAAAIGIATLALRELQPLPYAAAVLAGIVAAAFAFRTGHQLATGLVPPEKTQAAVGALIRNLIPFQAACLLLLPEAPWWGLGLLLGWPLALLLGRVFYGS